MGPDKPKLAGLVHKTVFSFVNVLLAPTANFLKFIFTTADVSAGCKTT